MVSKAVAKNFAELYVRHPKMKGDWHAVAAWLGFDFPPPMDESRIVSAIEAIGGKVPKLLAKETLAEHSEAKSTPDPIEADFSFEDIAADPPLDYSEEDWKAMADRLRPVMAQVAQTGGYVLNGQPIKASAAQVAALKVIFDRAEGRVHEKASTKAAPSGVVLLPSDDNFTCPNCGWRKDGQS